MKSLLSFAPMLGAALLTVASLATAQGVTIKVADQNGVGYAPGASNNGQGTSLTVLGTGTPTIHSGQSVTLSPGTYTIRAQPHPTLFRDYPGIVVTSSTTQIDLLWNSRTVVLRFVDQHGALLPGLTAAFPYYPGVANGGSVRVPINDSSLYPTLGYAPDNYRVDGNLYSGQLLRHTQNNVVGTTTTQIEHEWKTADVTVRLVDQGGADIVSNSAYVYVPWLGGGQSPLNITMPVNDSSIYPDLNTSVPFTDHYTWRVMPFGGVSLVRGWFDWMANPAAVFKVTPGTTNFTVVWQMQDVVLRAVDQAGNALPAINGERTSNRSVTVVTYPYPSCSSGGTLRLPVNDSATYPSLYGSGYPGNESAADGYDLRVTFDPGFSNTSMYQDGFLVTSSTTQIDVPWATVTGPLFVVDANGTPVSGSTFQITNPTGSGDIVRASGATVTLAVTDNTTYPNLQGGFANGYPIIVNPGDTTSSATFQFELLPNAGLLPQQVNIGGQSYGLRFIFNTPPVADAGNNLTIPGQDQGTTTIDGVATDADSNPLTFRWLDGNGTQVQASASVGTLGEAALALGGLPVLGLGNHTFVLEVSDGLALSTGTMTLTVDNSPPDSAVGGAITAELGADIALAASASDFDGDTLSWSWSEGSTVLASGSLATLAGGSPATLPTQTLVGGLSLGAHTLALSVNDGVNPAVVRIVPVTVIDTQAPTLAPVASQSILWPANHKLVDVTITLNASDTSGSVAYTVEVASNENPEKDGSGNTIPDFTVPSVDLVAGTVSVMLRAERSGRGRGRTYTITITATDSSGNQTTSALDILCPHDRRKN